MCKSSQEIHEDRIFKSCHAGIRPPKVMKLAMQRYEVLRAGVIFGGGQRRRERDIEDLP
jgi:hypothetical protein